TRSHAAGVYPLALHDALPIWPQLPRGRRNPGCADRHRDVPVVARTRPVARADGRRRTHHSFADSQMNEPISDSDLHAYVDGHLGAGRRAAVETWLAAHPDAAARVRGWKADADALRAALGDGAALPEAPRLDPLRVRGRVHSRRWDTMARAAVLVLALGLGGVGGWWARDGRDARSAPPMADAVTAYRLLSES